MTVEEYLYRTEMCYNSGGYKGTIKNYEKAVKLNSDNL
jgi:hypothetical protein